MKKLNRLSIAAISLMICSQIAIAQKAADLFKTYIPSNSEVLDEKYGDLNKDSISDAAVIIQDKGDGTESAEKIRTILIFFKAKDGTYKLACEGKTAIMGNQDGGVMGDPYQSMTVTAKGVIVIEFYGGSREKWNNIYRYRFQNGDFYLIGATCSGGNDDTYSYNYDYNVNTGKMIIKRKDTEDPGKNKSETRTVAKDPQPMLKSFTPGSLLFADDVSF
jgi:hypothetical protein